MKTIASRFVRSLAALIGLTSITASAQIATYTFSTIQDYLGSDISGGSNKAFTQTFTGVVGVQSMTYRFVRTAGTATNVNYFFVEWDTLTNRATSQLSNGVLNVPGISSFTSYSYTDPIDGPISYQGYDYIINLNAASLNATKTYAMVLLNPSTNLKLQLIDGADNFQYGAAFTANGITGYSALTTTSSTPYAPTGTDWGFAQIVVQVAVPEPATAAAGIGAILVAGLVGFRVMQRRRALAVAPVTVA